MRWTARVQHARVRKALRTEGMMGGLTLAQTADEIKLLSDLLDKELEVALKTGEMKTAPQTVKLQAEGISITEPAEAYRVALAYRRIKALLAPRIEEPRGPTGVRAGRPGRHRVERAWGLAPWAALGAHAKGSGGSMFCSNRAGVSEPSVRQDVSRQHEAYRGRVNQT